MFNVAILICAYFKTVSYYFFISNKVLKTTELLALFCVEILGFLMIVISGKIVSWKKCLFQIPEIPQRSEENSFQPQCIMLEVYNKR